MHFLGPSWSQIESFQYNYFDTHCNKLGFLVTKLLNSFPSRKVPPKNFLVNAYIIYLTIKVTLQSKSVYKIVPTVPFRPAPLLAPPVPYVFFVFFHSLRS